MKTNAAVEAIKYSLSLGIEGGTFLEMWIQGGLPEIREKWPNCPTSVFFREDALPNVAYQYRAKAYSVVCPKCDFELTGLICNPCGTKVECDECGNTFSVSVSAEAIID